MSKSVERFLLERAIERAIRELGNHEIGSEEYATTLGRVVTLHKMLAEEKAPSISRETMAVVGANLLGVVLIIAHEWTGPVTSKALSFIIRPRI